MSSEQILEATPITENIPFNFDADFWDELPPESVTKIYNIWNYMTSQKIVFGFNILYSMATITIVFKSKSKTYNKICNDLYVQFKGKKTTINKTPVYIMDF